MTKLLDLRGTCATPFMIENVPAGRLHPLIVLEFGHTGFVSMTIQDEATDDERNDLSDSIMALNAPEPSISLEEFRRQHGLR